ncbi:hypothetical protein D1631_09370 [Chryseobacterium nematophagum]|uniref:Immunity MXAN-0049 protein domain-containing protein n=1 Tax=Chryseobacterium nematophagum TaxID=2305228 RepID=A0A3M7TG93_9FLAO|nr:DUF1629 domain-containing protein [Chryseobacterium nematophagum]RNA62124.1 hypothetical protein D1631_09370 [Chryseobacterium nematophagum]
MNYYKINFTSSVKIRGNGDYIKDYKLRIPSDMRLLYWEIPRFVGNINHEKIDFEPYLLDIELFANSKINDLIMQGGPVPSMLILSGKLKTILEKYRKTGMQFFNINILKKDEIYNDYWLLNMYEFNQEFVNFNNSRIIYEKKDIDFNTTYSTKNIDLKVNDNKEFNIYIEKAKEKLEIITIEKLVLSEDVIIENFFALKYVTGGVGYYVSEKVKQEIEKERCTGLEFQPSYLSYFEWRKEREKIYGKM